MAKPLISINRRIPLDASAIEAAQRFSGYFTIWLEAGDFRMTEQQPLSLTYERRKFHVWQVVVAVVFFPIGLIALAAEKRVERIMMMVLDQDAGTGSVVTVSGSIAPGAGEQALRERLDAFDPGTAGPMATPGWYADPEEPVRGP